MPTRKEINEEYKSRNQKRRDAVRMATPADISDYDRKVLSMFEAYKRRYNIILKERGKDKVFHIDHINPIENGGPNHPDNLQIITSTENQKKHASLPKDGVFKHLPGARLRDTVEEWYKNRKSRNPDGTPVKGGKSINPEGKGKREFPAIDDKVTDMLDNLADTYEGSPESMRFVKSRIQLLKLSGNMDVINKGLNDLQPLFAARKKDEDKEITEVMIHVMPHGDKISEVVAALNKLNKPNQEESND